MNTRYWLSLVGMIWLAAGVSPAEPAPFIVERVGGAFERFTTHTQQPAWSESYNEPETGFVVTRLTDVSLAANKQSKNPPAYERQPDAAPGEGIGRGLTNGYSRFSNVNRDNRYFIAFGTGQLGCLYRMNDLRMQEILQGPDGKKISAEYSEIRWDRSDAPDSAGWFHYFSGKELHRQNVDKGPGSDEVLFTLPYPWVHKGDGDWDNAMRYVACAMKESPDIKDPVTKKNVKREVDIVGCFDREEGRLLPGMPRYDLAKTNLNGVDVSPDGKWMTAQTDFYRIDDLRKGIVEPRRGALRGGHGGWAWKNGRSVWVWQESATDYIQYYDPETEAVVQVMPIREIGWSQGLHVGSIKNPAFDGWALISTYGRNGPPLGNQVFMLELNRLNTATHPSYVKSTEKGAKEAALETWNKSWIPADQRARVWRLGTTACNMYVNGKNAAGYFAEAYASINWDGTMVSWAGNWWATDNLEIYRMTLPADWHQKLKAE